MGVPKFFRWLAERYPALLTRVNEFNIPAVDNFYLDMNGIIHSCSHPDDNNINARISEAKIFEDVAAYIDALVRIIGPRKVLFLAIDGVAPRAKMNQQRSRRFRAARDADKLEEEARMNGKRIDDVDEPLSEKILAQLSSKLSLVADGENDEEKRADSGIATSTPGGGADSTSCLSPEDQLQATINGNLPVAANENFEKRFDSNTITPGTDFMCRLDASLQQFIQRQVNEDPLWRNITVIYSSHLTPGEGEHKIMDYIRYARSQKEYNVRTRHCLYGLDADLIMLGMASHEPYFTLLREEVKFTPPPKRSGEKDEGSGGNTEPQLKNQADEMTFNLMHLSLLRDYLEIEFKDLKPILGPKFNVDAVIDDWVFMNMLIGNDFIPHLPFMHINKGSIQKFGEAYVRAMPEMQGYLNDCGTLHVDRFMIFIGYIAQAEKELIDESRDTDEFFDFKRISKPQRGCKAKETDYIHEDVRDNYDENQQSTMSAEDFAIADQAAYDAFVADLREKYYTRKFGISQPTDDDVRTITHELVRALVWNLGYYYSGVQSWSWYYPYHYSPFASDISRVCTADQVRDIEFPDNERGRPFMPFEQLMAVLPARSNPCLPVALHALFGAESSIYDFYPTDFQEDMEDKVNEWEAVVCIPFVDEQRLLKAIASVLPHLTDAERLQNTIQPSYIYTFDADTTPNLIGECAAAGVKIQTLTYEQMLLPKLDIKYGLLVDASSLLKFRKGYPRFLFTRYSSTLTPAAVKFFMHSSRGLSIVLKVDNAPLTAAAAAGDATNNDRKVDAARINAEAAIARKCLRRDILVNWPYLYEARVERVISGLNGLQYACDREDSSSVVESNYDDLKEFRRQTSLAQAAAREKLGIDIGSTCCMLNVRRKTGHYLYYNNDGRSAQLKPTYERKSREMPLQLCVPRPLGQTTVHEDAYGLIEKCGFKLLNESAGGVDKRQQPLESYIIDVTSIFRPNDIVVHLTVPFYGAVGRVVDVFEQTQQRGAWGQPNATPTRVMVRVQLLWQNDPDMDMLWQQCHVEEPKYKSARDCVKDWGMSAALISMFTGTLLVLHSSKPGANIVKQQKEEELMLRNAKNAEEEIENNDDTVADNDDSNADKANGDAVDEAARQQQQQVTPKSNIGLNLKNNKLMREIRGYTRKGIDDGQWRYSDRVGVLLTKWRDHYPEVVKILEQRNAKDVAVDELFPNDRQPMEALRGMRKFIKEQLLPETERIHQPVGCDFIDDINIVELRTLLKQHRKEAQYMLEEAFRPQNLFKFFADINDNAPADRYPTHRLWDRVVNVRPNYAVPLGLRGTVVRVEYEEEYISVDGSGEQQNARKSSPHQRLIQVLWDVPVKSVRGDGENKKSSLTTAVAAGVVNGMTDMSDVPPCYLMNLTFGLKEWKYKWNSGKTTAFENKLWSNLTQRS